MAIAANLATTILQSSATRLEDTRVGKALTAAGLLEPNLNDRLRAAITRSIRSLRDSYPQCQMKGVLDFLGSEALAQDIHKYLLDATPPNRDRLKRYLADCLDIPRGTPSHAWPNRLHPDQFLDHFFSALKSELARESDPGLLLIQGEINLLSARVHQVNDDIAGLRERVSFLFDQSALKQQKRRFKTFEDQFIEHIQQRCERLTTPGARELHGLKQSLTIAYISLKTKTVGGAEPIQAEELIIDNSLLTIRGPAGSGKTTLLSWVALKCAHGRHHPNQWSGGVPFLVPLRTVARMETGAPRVENFVRYSVDEQIWTVTPPDGWLDDVLRSQRAVIMIDGVDELPALRRVVFWDWVDDFAESYPGNRIVVTSRTLPGSLTSDAANRNEQWSPPKAFLDAELEPMSLSDIREFIHHWHDAVDRSKLDRYEIAELDRARLELPSKLEDPANRRIRELCGTPLLCAVVCVLNWREEGYLPRRRVDLYARCCDMLIEERDLKRGLPKPQGALGFITKNDKELVLQRIAFNMIHSRPDGDEVDTAGYRIEIPRAKAVQWIRGCLASFHDSQARSCEPEELLNYLVERTGLLREPAGDLIDFPHRSFQEYLAACAAGAGGQEEFLAKQADDDQWHETIMLAAGTHTGGVHFGRSLVEALLKRGERHKSRRQASQRKRKTCFALALGCLENLRQQDEGLRERVLAHLDDLVPPRSTEDAKILSVAGDAVVPHLAYTRWKDERTSTIEACAEALVHIGTASATKELLNSYAADRREPVIARVCQCPNVDLSKVPLVASEVEQSGSLPRYACPSGLAQS